ncbi:MAG: response regulator [Ktedonobacterales bacterium]
MQSMTLSLAQTVEPSVEPSGTPGTHKTHVLVVDDDRAIRDLLQFALELEGYEVVTLCDGRQVVETLAQWDEPSIALMDLMMPLVDGWEACRRLAARDDLARHTVIVMSAATLPGDEYPERASTLLCKPFDLTRALDLVGQVAAGTLTAGASPATAPFATVH